MLEGHKATWAIFNPDGTLRLKLNCLYDATDVLSEIAKVWTIDYEKKTIHMIKESKS